MKSLKGFVSVLVTILFSVNLFAQTDEINKKQILQELLTFKDTDLSAENYSESRKKAQALFISIGLQENERREREKFPLWNVRYIWQTNDDQLNPKFAVMESMTFIFLPGQQTHNFYFFDKNGNLLNQERFSTGWRMMVGKVELIKNDDFKFPIVQISAVGGGSFAYASSTVQYYALLEDSVVLIRLKSKTRTVLNLDDRNSYGFKYPSIGPIMPDRTIEEWVKSLHSESKSEILRTLMWLAGEHETIDELNQDQKMWDDYRKNNPKENSPKSKLENYPDVIQDVKTFEAVKNREDVQIRLQELVKSPVQWIKEAAELALKPIEKRKGN